MDIYIYINMKSIIQNRSTIITNKKVDWRLSCCWGTRMWGICGNNVVSLIKRTAVEPHPVAIAPGPLQSC